MRASLSLGNFAANVTALNATTFDRPLFLCIMNDADRPRIFYSFSFPYSHRFERMTLFFFSPRRISGVVGFDRFAADSAHVERRVSRDYMTSILTRKNGKRFVDSFVKFYLLIILSTLSYDDSTITICRNVTKRIRVTRLCTIHYKKIQQYL